MHNCNQFLPQMKIPAPGSRTEYGEGCFNVWCLSHFESVFYAFSEAGIWVVCCQDGSQNCWADDFRLIAISEDRCEYRISFCIMAPDLKSWNPIHRTWVSWVCIICMDWYDPALPRTVGVNVSFRKLRCEVGTCPDPPPPGMTCEPCGNVSKDIGPGARRETVRCVNRVNSFLASVNGMCFYTVWLDADACIICIMPSPGQGQKKSVYQTNCYRDSGTIWLVCRLKQIDLDTQMRIDTLFPGLSVFVAFIQNFILYFVICLEALAALEDLIHDLENNNSYNAQFNNAMHSFSFGKSWAWNSQKLKLKSLKVPFEQSFLLHQSAEIHDTKMLLPIVQDCCSWSRSLWLWCGWCWCWCRPRWRPF